VFLTLPSRRGRREEFTGENPSKNRRTACPHAPTTALPTRDHSRHALHASSSPDSLQLNRVDPPRQQPVSSHASNSAQSSDTSSDQSSATSSSATSAKRVRAFATSSKVGPGLITWMPRHHIGF
jgi:hypothetical protein